MIAQGTPEWRAARLGKVTASRIADVMAKIKSGAPSASRANYLTELVLERLTGGGGERFRNAYMDAGNEVEAKACEAYAWDTDAVLEEVGFVDHPTIPMTGASPDRLVGADGLLEMKCHFTAEHLNMLLHPGSPPEKHLYQAQWQMACTGRKWCDLGSYDERFPSHLRLRTVRIPRADDLIKAIEEAVVAFLAEVEDKMRQLEAISANR